MAAATVVNTGDASVNGVGNSPAGMKQVIRYINFTSTDVTDEVNVGDLGKIIHWDWARVGAASSAYGVLSLSETFTSGILTVDADNDVTVVRAAGTSAATLAAESFTLRFLGYGTV